MFMLYFTLQFIKLVNEVEKSLGIAFCDEKNQLKWSLGVFLFTYFLRALLKGLTVAFHVLYGNVWDYPLYAEALVCSVQFIYDVLPLLMISYQHHTTFKNESRAATEALFRATSANYSRDFTQLNLESTEISRESANFMRKSSYSEVYEAPNFSTSLIKDK